MFPDVPRLYNRPYETFPMLEAAGAAAGHAEDASMGLTTMRDGAGNTWAWNDVVGEWERLYTIKSGDTLFNLSGTFYGAKSLDGVHAIYDVPQNKAIQGPSPDSGLIPGDVILIPGLPQPGVAPAAADSIPLSLPQSPPTGIFPATSAGSPLPVTVTSSAPAGWPQGVPFPPTSATGSSVVLASDDGSGGGPITLPTVQVTGDPNSPDAGAPFWTGGRIALAAGAGLVGVATVAFLATRKKRRRRAA